MAATHWGSHSKSSASVSLVTEVGSKTWNPAPSRRVRKGPGCWRMGSAPIRTLDMAGTEGMRGRGRVNRPRSWGIFKIPQLRIDHPALADPRDIEPRPLGDYTTSPFSQDLMGIGLRPTAS